MNDNTNKKDPTALNAAAHKFGEEFLKFMYNNPDVKSTSTHSHSSTTKHDSVHTVNGQVVSEKHWVKTLGDNPDTHTDHH
jgi:hypothetical protein